MKVVCTECGTSFFKPESHVRRVKKVFCSKACHDSWQRRNGRSVDKACKICGKAFRVARSAARKFSTCSRECYLQAKRKDNNGNWKGGVTQRRKADLTTARYRRWRRGVFERDAYICVNCGKRGGTLCADHIKSWAHHPELRYDLDNGRTLCLDCHKLTYYYSLRRKLTDEQAVRVVLRKRTGMPLKDLAEEFGVAVCTVQRISTFKAYRHATAHLFGGSFPRSSEERLKEVACG